jgi:ribosomal protein S18 acetylase RimI-like enzyme
MEKTVALKDGTEVTIRDMEPDDVQRSFDFFAELPKEDRKYLRVDVTRWEFVERRIHDIDPSRVRRLVVIHDDEVVADGALELEGHGWGGNIAEIRLIVSHQFQRRGLGLLLARELYFIAAEAKVDRVVARMMRPQAGAQRIMKRLGFHDEFLIPEHVRDQDGNWQDMIIMRCNLEDLWKEMEGVFEGSDIRWHR